MPTIFPTRTDGVTVLHGSDVNTLQGILDGPVWINVLDPQYGAKGDGTTDDTAAIQAAVNAAVGAGTVSSTVYFPYTTTGYKTTAAITLPTAGTSGLVLQGASLKGSIINPTGGIPFLTASAGYHYDLVLRDLLISGATNAINLTTTGQVVRLVLERVYFNNCAVALNFNTAGGVVGFTLRNCIFQTCSGDNIKCNPSYQASPGLLDTCWFQSSSYNTYINAAYVSSTAGDNWTLRRCVFEGAHPATTTAPIVIGGVKCWTFDGCQFSDFNNLGTNLPLIQTVAAVNGAPNLLKFQNCDLENNNGVVINLLNTGAGASIRWMFDTCFLVSKTSTSPLTLSNGGPGILFLDSHLSAAQSWASGSAGLYINAYEAGVTIPFKQVGSTSYPSSLVTDGMIQYGADLRRSKQSPAFSAAPTPDPTLGEIYAMAALTGNVSVGNPVNAAQGQRLRFYWLQDGTGGRTVTYSGTNFRATGITAQTTTANTFTIDEAECLDGTVWRVVRLVTGQT